MDSYQQTVNMSHMAKLCAHFTVTCSHTTGSHVKYIDAFILYILLDTINISNVDCDYSRYIIAYYVGFLVIVHPQTRQVYGPDTLAKSFSRSGE